MPQVLYIPQSPGNLIYLAKLNDNGLYWDNFTLALYNAKRTGNSFGYILKWQETGSFDYKLYI